MSAEPTGWGGVKAYSRKKEFPTRCHPKSNARKCRMGLSTTVYGNIKYNILRECPCNTTHVHLGLLHGVHVGD